MKNQSLKFKIRKKAYLKENENILNVLNLDALEAILGVGVAEDNNISCSDYHTVCSGYDATDI